MKRWLLFGKEHRAETGLQQPSEWLVDAFAGSATPSGQRVSIRGSLGIISVFAAVHKISESIGTLPLKVYQELDEDERVEAKTHRSYRMLHAKPNPITPAHRFWSTVTGHLLLWGNAFIRKERSEVSGLVESLWILEPWEVTVEWNQSTGVKRFIQRPASSGEKRFTQDEVVHVFDWSLNGVTGESRIARTRNQLGTVMARAEFEGGFYKRGATLSGVIEHPKILTDTVKLRDSFTAVYGGSDNAHKTAVLEEGAHFQSMSAPLRDLQFVESQQLSNTDVAILFGIPPSYLGGATGDSLTYSTVEGNRIQYADALSPICTNIAQTVNADVGIFPYGSWFSEFDLKGLMRGDSKSRSDFYKAMSEIGAMTVDEIRATENLPPLPEGAIPAAAPAPAVPDDAAQPPTTPAQLAAVPNVARGNQA